MTGNIFINYRRSGDWSYARLLFGELLRKYDRAQIFIDVDNIAPGEDFVRVLNEKVAQSDVVLAVIGPKWLEARDEKNKRRLDDPRDFVRIEIEQALKTGVRIIPLLVDGARMPDSGTLPESMSALSNRNAVRLSPDTFNADAQLLMVTIEKALTDSTDQRRKDDETWEMATREGSPEALQSYLAAFPRGQHASEAERRLDELRNPDVAIELASWQFVEKRQDEKKVRQHLARYPQGPTAHMARVLLEELVWKRVAATKDIETFDDFLREFPDGEFVKEARERRQQIEDRIEGEHRKAEETERRKEEKADEATAGGNFRRPSLIQRSAALMGRAPRLLTAFYCIVLFFSLATLSSPIYSVENGVSTITDHQKNLPSYALAGILLLAGYLFICWRILSIGKSHTFTDRAKAAIGMKTWLLGILLPLSVLLLPLVILFLQGNSLLPEWLPFRDWPLRGFLAVLENVWFYPLPLAWFAAIEIHRSFRDQPGHSISFSYAAATVSILSSLCLCILAADYLPDEFTSSWLGSLALPGLLVVSCGLLVWFLLRTGAQQGLKRYIIQSGSLLIPQAAVTMAVVEFLPDRRDAVLVPFALVSLAIFVGMIAAVRWLARRLQVRTYLRQSHNHPQVGG